MRVAGDNTPFAVVVGGGIGGLTTALALHAAGVTCVVLEAVETFSPIGAGVNIMPHAAGVMTELGLAEQLSTSGVVTKEAAFFNRFGQLIYRERAGIEGGFAHPQYSVHRGDLHEVLLSAVVERLGPDAVRTGARVIAVEQDAAGVRARVRRPDGSTYTVSGEVLIAADGLHSVVRGQLHPRQTTPRYSGVTMWRGVSVWEPFLSGATMVRAGWLTHGKMVIYPVRENFDGQGRQLVNWVAEIQTPADLEQDWSRAGRFSDFLPAFAEWKFDWLDVPAMMAAAERVLLFPMVDRDPLGSWGSGRITLLGDAAHPMVPRGSNGAGQAILDARCVAACLGHAKDDPVAALERYEAERRPPTSAIVRLNRENPPDAILREVYERTGDRPFANIDDVISQDALKAVVESYRAATGQLRTHGGLADLP